MTDDIQQLLQHIGRLAYNSPPTDEWDEVKVIIRAITSYVEQDVTYLHKEKTLNPVFIFMQDDDLDYEQQATPSFEKLRQLMYDEAPFRGAWYTAVMTITKEGKFDTEFEYEQQPAFDHKPVPKAYALDFQHFPRNKASTPDWLKEIVQQHGLAYHEPEPLA